MNKMTEYQCKLVEKNLDIIDWVIRCRVKVNGQVLQTYEDFYQIGCEALCRAAMAYHPERGTFSPLGSRYVYNAIIDHCRKQNMLQQYSTDLTDEDGGNQFLFDSVSIDGNIEDRVFGNEVWVAFHKCKEKQSGTILRGMEALELKSIGFTTREIAQRYDTTVNSVNAWISKARVVLRNEPDILALCV